MSTSKDEKYKAYENILIHLTSSAFFTQCHNFHSILFYNLYDLFLILLKSELER